MVATDGSVALLARFSRLDFSAEISVQLLDFFSNTVTPFDAFGDFLGDLGLGLRRGDLEWGEAEEPFFGERGERPRFGTGRFSLPSLSRILGAAAESLDNPSKAAIPTSEMLLGPTRWIAIGV